jgi:deazaflavin-dependent oxidoreductase (nitroreductase family)
MTAAAKVPPTVQDWVKDHVRRYLESDGADGHMIKLPTHSEPVPTLLLTTTGRRSGEKFLFPLIYGSSGDGFVIIASKGGAPDHPGWYKNLLADPRVEVQVGSRKFAATARTIASSPERTALWDQMAALFPPYTGYQEKTDREIPVVVLDPAR